MTSKKSRERLDHDLDGLELPTRAVHLIERLGLRTVRDLAGIHPARLRNINNFGARSVAATRATLQRYLGTSWETAWKQIHGRSAAGAGGRTGISWPLLQQRLPAEHRGVLLSDVVGLPARMRSIAARRRLETVGALIDTPLFALQRSKNLGRKGIADTIAAIVELIGRTPAPAGTTDSKPSVPNDALPEIPGGDSSRPRDIASDHVLKINLPYLALPAAARSLAQRQSLRTVGDLVAIYPGVVAKDLGPSPEAFARTRLILEALLGTTWEDAYKSLCTRPHR